MAQVARLQTGGSAKLEYPYFDDLCSRENFPQAAEAKGTQRWSQCKAGNIKLQLNMAKEILHRLEIAPDHRDLSIAEEWLRRKLKLHCLGLASLERTVARLRSRIRYLREGDANTSFFHQHRKRKNFIAKFHEDNQIFTSQAEKQQAAFDFYEGLLGSAEPGPCSYWLPAARPIIFGGAFFGRSLGNHQGLAYG